MFTPCTGIVNLLNEAPLIGTRLARSASRLLRSVVSRSLLALSQADERRKIAVQVDQPVEVDHHPHQHHDHSRSDFDLV